MTRIEGDYVMSIARRAVILLPKGGIMLVMLLGISACGSRQSWKEDVALSDGRVIVVEREFITEPGGAELVSNSSGTKPKEDWIAFNHPEVPGAVVKWRTMKLDSSRWPEVPLVLDLEDGKPVIFTLVSVSAGCKVYSKYVYYNGAWTEEILPDSFMTKKTNLLFGSRENSPKHMSLADKEDRNSWLGYLKSLRQVGPARTICSDDAGP